MLKAIIKLLRPKQWVKNLFVFAGLLFDRKWNEPETVTAVLLVFAGFCLAASAIYILNDYLDREEDRRHPRKRLRPIASGEVKPGLAFTLFAVFLTAGLGIHQAHRQGNVVGGVIGWIEGAQRDAVRSAGQRAINTPTPVG